MHFRIWPQLARYHSSEILLGVELGRTFDRSLFWRRPEYAESHTYRWKYWFIYIVCIDLYDIQTGNQTEKIYSSTYICKIIFMLLHFGKRNFLMTPHVRLLVGWSVMISKRAGSYTFVLLSEHLFFLCSPLHTNPIVHCCSGRKFEFVISSLGIIKVASLICKSWLLKRQLAGKMFWDFSHYIISFLFSHILFLSLSNTIYTLCLSISISLCLWDSLSFSLSIYVSIYLSIYLSINLSLSLAFPNY